MANEKIRKQYDGGVVDTTLAASITAGATTVTLTDGSTFPDATHPFVIAVDRGGATEEKMLVGARSSNTLTITERGYDGTTAASHATGVSVSHVLDAHTLDQANELANVMTTRGDTIYRNSAGDPARLAIGAANTLYHGGTDPSFSKLVNADVDAAAAIAYSKLNLGTSIVNADVSASAAIVDTKLAQLTTANKVAASAIDIDGATDIGADLADADLILVDDGAGGTNRKSAISRLIKYLFGNVSGDVTIGSTGVAAIGSGVIVNADVNASAAIAYSKLALATSIVAGDLASGLTVISRKIGMSASRTTNLSCANSATTAITWPTEDYDSDAGFTANGSTYTVPVTGTYLITVKIASALGLLDGTYNAFLQIVAGGVTYKFQALWPEFLTVTHMQPLTAADTIQCLVENSTGAAITDLQGHIHIRAVGF